MSEHTLGDEELLREALVNSEIDDAFDIHELLAASDMHKALNAILEYFNTLEKYACEPKKLSQYRTASGDDLDCLFDKAYPLLNRALTKAEGESNE